MKITRNLSAALTNRQLLRTENKLSLSMERLSSGYKINKAGDNPAGMAISHKMRAQINGLDQAETNAEDGQSVLRIADGALNEVSNMLQRMRELSVQAANGTNSYSDRQSIQDEIAQLTEEVDRISTDTEYNQQTLLDGSANVRSYAKGMHNVNGTSTVYSQSVSRLDVSEQVLPGTYKLTVENGATAAESGLLDFSNATQDGTVTINNVSVDYKAGMNMEDFFQSLRQAAEEAGYVVDAEEDANNQVNGKFNIYSASKGSRETLSITVSNGLAQEVGLNGATQDPDSKAWTAQTTGTDATVKITEPDGSGFDKSATYSAQGNRIKITDNGGFSIDFLLSDEAQPDDTIEFDVTDIGALSIQIGANQYQDMDVLIPEVSAKSLYLDTVDVAVSGGADKALVTLDEAIAKLSSVRSGIGAYTNRLEYASSSLAETQEDMTNAYSGIMDTDMAEEMTEFTQQNVLEQASMSVLAQANDLPQQVLSLLQR